MVANYVKLFELKFFHRFYGLFSAKDLITYPSRETQNHLVSYGILFKQTNEGFILINNSEKQDLLKRLKAQIPLQFGIKIKNKYFGTFSDIEQSTETKKYIFSNSHSIEKEEKNEDIGKIKINSNGFVNKKDVCLCSYNNLKLRDLLGIDKVIVEQYNEILFDGKLTQNQNAGGVLSNGYGTYNISVNDSQELKLTHLPESFIKDFGIIELVLGGEGSFEEIVGQEYQIHFDYRKIQWNYYFISKSNVVYDSIDIFSGKEKLMFSAPEHTVLINGQQAIKVSSEELFPMEQRYEGKYFNAVLKSTSDSNLVNKKINLPTPDVTRIKGKREQGTEIYFSDMYIYL
ncbi:MAG: hypothetical protein ACI9C9_000188 [Marivirga sp.]|jgi:hypothetical protein